VEYIKENNMTVYTQISKELGWDEMHVSLPKNKDIVHEMITMALNGDRNAFQGLFMYIRFGQVKDESDLEVNNLIYEGFQKAKPIFENMEV
jgi:hypothetical protein